MPDQLHDDQRFGEFGLSNDEGAARKRASLAADFEAQIEAKRAERAESEREHEATADSAPAPGTIEERAFSERVSYGDVRRLSKSFYKGLIASVVVVVLVVIAIIVLSPAAL